MNDPILFLSRYGLEVLNRFYGVLPGQVVNIIEDGSGKLQVRIFGTRLGETEVTAIPLNFGGGRGYGVRFPLPKRGEMVNLLFKNGNLASAYWTYCGWHDNAPVEFKDSNSWGIVSPSGNKIIVNRDVNGKENLTIKFDGGITIESAKGVTITSPVNSVIPSGDNGFNILGNSDAGGWAVATQLAERLNLLVGEIESLKQELATHTHTAPPSGGATTPPVVPLMTNITEFSGSTFVDPNNIS